MTALAFEIMEKKPSFIARLKKSFREMISSRWAYIFRTGYAAALSIFYFIFIFVVTLIQFRRYRTAD
jgi:ABC-type sugar transport system permease subunit